MNIEVSKIEKPKLSEKQEYYRKQWLGKIKNKEVKLVDIKCLCSEDKKGDTFINDQMFPLYEDVGMKNVMCNNCSLVRTTPYYDNEAIIDYYTNFYRNMYTPWEQVQEITEAFYSGIYSREEGKRKLSGGYFVYEFLSPYIKEYKKRFNKEKLKIFEIGCGYGAILYQFHLDKEEVYGCDYGEEGINFGKEKGMNLVVGDMNELKAFGKPDIVILNHILEHVVDIKDFLGSLKDMISKDTLIFIGVPDLLLHQVSLSPQSFFQEAHIWHFCENNLNSIMNKSGFTTIKIISGIFGLFSLNKNNYDIQVNNNFSLGWKKIMLSRIYNLWNNSQDASLAFNKLEKRKKQLKYTKVVSVVIIIILLGLLYLK